MPEEVTTSQGWQGICTQKYIYIYIIKREFLTLESKLLFERISSRGRDRDGHASSIGCRVVSHHTVLE